MAVFLKQLIPAKTDSTDIDSVQKKKDANVGEPKPAQFTKLEITTNRTYAEAVMDIFESIEFPTRVFIIGF